MATVIIGGGIIGASTAFYLTELTRSSSEESSQEIHIIDSSPELVASASGYAGGFLAKDWFAAESSALGALSFDLHASLAAKYDGAKTWGYSPSTTYSLRSSKTARRGEEWLTNGTSRVSAAAGLVTENVPAGEPSWLIRNEGDGLEIIGKDTSAQVDPKRLTMFLLETARERGVKVHHPCMPTRLNMANDGFIQSVEIASSTGDSGEKTTIPCRKVVIAAGAWTPQVYKTLFPTNKKQVPISSLAGHSLLLRTDKWAEGDELNSAHKSAVGGGCHAIYSSTHTAGIGDWSPEIYSRIGGEIYIAGLNDSRLPLPRLATDRVLEPEKLAIVMEQARRLVGVQKVAELEVLREGLCFRPVTNRGTPIIGEVKKDVYIAAGHGPWGISMSLGTGTVLAEKILGKTVSADISGLGL